MKNLPKLSLGRLGILLLAALCIGVFLYDMTANQVEGSLPAEAPVAAMTLNPQVIPEPGENLTVAQAPAPAAAEDTFYADYRLEREQVRAEELELLQSVIDDTGAARELRDAATARKLEIAHNMEYELMTERVLLAKDFGQSVVMLARDSATVVLSGPFDDIKAAQVAEAVSGVTGLAFENIVIINR